MIDIVAAFSLAAAAGKMENPPQLFADAELLFRFYGASKAAPPDFVRLAETGELKKLVQAAARVTAVANSLVDDPAQMQNIVALLASI